MIISEKLAKLYFSNKEKIKEIEDANSKIREAVLNDGKNIYPFKQYVMVVKDGNRNSLSKELLLENNVSLDVIQKSMVNSTYKTLTVSKA